MSFFEVHDKNVFVEMAGDCTMQCQFTTNNTYQTINLMHSPIQFVYDKHGNVTIRDPNTYQSVFICETCKRQWKVTSKNKENKIEEI